MTENTNPNTVRRTVAQLTFRSKVLAALNDDPSVGDLGSYETEWMDGATPELVAFHLNWLFDAQTECRKAGDLLSAEHYFSVRLTIENALESRGCQVLYAVDPMDGGLNAEMKGELIVTGWPAPEAKR